jgi:hypothetical protein
MPQTPRNDRPDTEPIRPGLAAAAIGSMVRPGEVWLARGARMDDAARMVAVLDVDPNAKASHAALVSTDVDLGTESDLVLPPSYTGIAFPIVVHCDVVGPLWSHQLVSRVGCLAREHTEATALALLIESVGNTGYERLPAQFRGPPVRNAFDWRLRYKRFELDAMLALTRPYLTVALNPASTAWERVAIAASEAIAAVSAKRRLQVAPPTLARVWAYANEVVTSESVRSDPIVLVDLGFAVEAERHGDKLLVFIDAPAAQREAIARSRFEVVHDQQAEPFQFDEDGKVWLSVPMSQEAFVRVRSPQS